LNLGPLGYEPGAGSRTGLGPGADLLWSVVKGALHGERCFRWAAPPAVNVGRDLLWAKAWPRCLLADSRAFRTKRNDFGSRLGCAAAGLRSSLPKRARYRGTSPISGRCSAEIHALVVQSGTFPRGRRRNDDASASRAKRQRADRGPPLLLCIGKRKRSHAHSPAAFRVTRSLAVPRCVCECPAPQLRAECPARPEAARVAARRSGAPRRPGRERRAPPSGSSSRPRCRG